MNIPWEALAALGIYVFSSTVGFIIWLSKMSVKLDFMSELVREMSKTMAQHEAMYVKKEDLSKDLAWRDSRIEGMGKKLDALQA